MAVAAATELELQLELEIELAASLLLAVVESVSVSLGSLFLELTEEVTSLACPEEAVEAEAGVEEAACCTFVARVSPRSLFGVLLAAARLASGLS
jgi:hypothetical protein